MNKKQSKYYAMHLATQGFMDAQSAVWSTVARVVDYKNNFDELVHRISEMDTEAQATVSVTQRKEQVKIAIAAKLSALSGGIQAYAYELNDMDLVKAVAVSKTDIERLKDSELEGFVNAFIGKIMKHLPALADYGITEARINELKTSVDDWNALLGKPRILINSKYVALGTLDALVDETNALLANKMDKVMMLFKTGNPSFYDGYIRSRVILDF